MLARLSVPHWAKSEGLREFVWCSGRLQHKCDSFKIDCAVGASKKPYRNQGLCLLQTHAQSVSRTLFPLAKVG